VKSLRISQRREFINDVNTVYRGANLSMIPVPSEPELDGRQTIDRVNLYTAR
jgi:hypothetical protein